MSHWYVNADGSAAHFIGKNNRPTSLTDARRMLKEGTPISPSVTSIADVRNRSALVKWLQQEAVLMTVEVMSKSSGVGPANASYDRSWADSVIAAAKSKTMEKADAGTDIHAKLEAFQLNPFDIDRQDYEMCDAIDQCILRHTGMSLFTDFIAEKSFADQDHWYGGMCDLHNEHWIIDYKTKDEVSDKTKGYPEQGEQLAAYRQGLLGAESKARTANLFISRTPPLEGEPWGVVWYEHKTPDYHWECFRQTLILWQMLKKFGPHYDRWLSEK